MKQKGFMRKKKFLIFSVSLVMVLSSTVLVKAQESNVLLEDGVKVTMSSSAMDAASASLATGDVGTARSKEWYNGDVEEVTYRNTNVEAIDLIKSIDSNSPTIQIDDDTQFQSFAGIGASFEHSTVYNLMQLSESKRREVIRYMIDPENGLGYTMFRVPVGTSDFIPSGYTLYSYYDTENNEVPENPDWYNESGNGFTIEKDIEFGVIAVLQTLMEEAENLGIKDDIHIFGDMWSCPGWMKDDKTKGLNGGNLSDEHIDDLAMYFVRWIEELNNYGIPVYSIDMQNQTVIGGMFSIPTMPTCGVTGEQEAKLSLSIREKLNDSTSISNIQKNVKILGYSYTYGEVDNGVFVETLYANENSCDGICLHDYRNSTRTFIGLQDYSKYGEVSIAERSLWGTYGMNRICNYFRNNARSYNAWVTMLGSNLEGIGGTSADPVMFIREGNEVRYLPEAHMTGQFGKIRPGYIRVASNDSYGNEDYTVVNNEYGISNVVFKDPDTGKLVMVVVNNSSEVQSFSAECDDYSFNAEIPAETVATYEWNPNDIDTVAPEIIGNDNTVLVGNTDSIENIINLQITDNKDGIILPSSELVTIESNYDASKAGEYFVMVSATDKAGNYAENKFKIIVKNKDIEINTSIQDKPSKVQSPKTGDDYNVVLSVMTVIGSIVLLGIVIYRKKIIS